MHIVFVGLTVSSAWGNGHATTYRSLIRGVCHDGHAVTFLERDVPWYASHRDFTSSAEWQLTFYKNLHELRSLQDTIANADAVIVGSYVPEGVAVIDWVLDTARGPVGFYDIDTPVTLAKLAQGDQEYLAPRQIPAFDIYFSFTGGPTLQRLERHHGARRARPLYCAVDPDHHKPVAAPTRWDLGYLGTYSKDRQALVENLLLAVAERYADRPFVVGGPNYPENTHWPANVTRMTHVAPAEHSEFYAAQRFTLNLTRQDMVQCGWSPSVRLFEAAACGVATISDHWNGIEEFFQPGTEILIARKATDVEGYLYDMPPEERRSIASRARQKVLAHHTGIQRARQLVRFLQES